MTYTPIEDAEEALALNAKEALAFEAGEAPEPEPAPATAPFRPARYAALLGLSFAHGAADITQSAVPALVPFFVAERGYSYAAAGAFVLAASIGGVILQPLAGVLGDRTGARWLFPAGLVVTGVGVGVVGLAESYALALIIVALSSIGFATCHPEATRFARVAAGTNVVTGISIYQVGGSAGYALGPVLVALFVGYLGMRGTVLLAVPALIAAGLMLVVLRRLPLAPTRHTAAQRFSHLRDEWGPYARLVAFVSIGSIAITGLMVFVPLYLVEAHGISPGHADTMSTILLVAAAFSTLLGGRLADRYGRRSTLVIPMLVLVPLIAVLPSLGYAAMLPVMVVIGLVMNLGMSTFIVVATEYLPGRIGLATGLLVGINVAVGGGVTPLLGWLADTTSPSAVLYVCALAPLIAGLLAATLPRPAATLPGQRWGLHEARA